MADLLNQTSLFDANTAITVVVTFAAAWLAFYLAKRRDDRLRIIDIAIDLYSGDFSRKRSAVLLGIRALDRDDLVRTAERDDPFNADLRQSAIDLMNRHEFTCYLYNQNFINRTVFEKYLMATIISDQEALSAFRDSVHLDYENRGVADARPFYPEILRMRRGGG